MINLELLVNWIDIECSRTFSNKLEHFRTFCSLTNILGYGKQAENVLKHSVTKLVTDCDELEKERQSPFFKDSVEVLDEADDLACYMVRSKKKKITDAKPVHIGVAILQWSKLLFLR